MNTPTLYSLVKSGCFQVGHSIILEDQQVSSQLAKLRKKGFDCQMETHKCYMLYPQDGASQIMVAVTRVS
jgi:hypothetical protein